MKADGEEFEVPEIAADKPKVVDIMAALESAGLAVAGPASTVSDALSAIQSRPLRGALLDAHLGGFPEPDGAEMARDLHSPGVDLLDGCGELVVGDVGVEFGLDLIKFFEFFQVFLFFKHLLLAK